ncbi:MAG: nucleotidyltransferase family protein [Deltaproteobacteria bacterium]|nr:nucleotidyltransferase family protein [Deltaproteobacteria bacterium]
MKAMILAAGLGTRLRPLTLKMPKALLPVANRPLIDRTIAYLKAQGVSRIVVNAHHCHRRMVEHLANNHAFGMGMDVRVEPDILGTGGGIKNTADFWDAEPFIVINGDILTDIDLSQAYEMHQRKGALATLVLHDYGPFNQIRVDRALDIRDIARETPSGRPGRLAFTGVHVMDPALLTYIPEGVFSDIIDCYRGLIKSGIPPKAHVVKGHYWRDIGTVRSYVLANREYVMKENRLLAAPNCRIDPSVTLAEWAVIGENGNVEEGAEIRRSILWEKVKVRKGVKVIDSIVTSSKEVASDLIDGIL